MDYIYNITNNSFAMLQNFCQKRVYVIYCVKDIFQLVCSENYPEFKEIKILVATVSWITRMECGPQFVLTHILCVLSCLSFKRLFSHVCSRVETKELLFEASWVGMDEEELVFLSGQITYQFLFLCYSQILLIQVIFNQKEQSKKLH